MYQHRCARRFFLSLLLLFGGFLFAEEPAQETKQKSAFREFVNKVSTFFSEVAQGPRVHREAVIPLEFMKGNYVVRKRVADEKLFYVESLDRKTLPAEGAVLFAYNVEDERACELEVISVIDSWFLVRNRSCQRFLDIAPGDFLVAKTEENEQRYRRRYSHDYISGWLQQGDTDMSIDGTKYSGKNLRYGARVAMDLSSITRVHLNYGVGKNDLKKASSGVEGGFQGNSLSSFHVLGRWSERWQNEFKDFTLVPMLGIGTFFETLHGHPQVRTSGGGLTGGVFVKSDRFKTILDATLNYCLIGCQVVEAGRSVVAVYPDPKILELRISAKSEVLPWAGFGVLTSIEYYSVTAGSAQINSETSTGRSLKDSYLGFGLGLTYSWK